MTTQDYQIVQLASLGDEVDRQLRDAYRVLPLWQDSAPQERLHEAASASVAITSVRKGLTRQDIDRLPNLKAICSWGVGYETLDVAHAHERGIAVSNTPDVLDGCVADLAWALLLTASRRTNTGDRYVKTGQWKSIGAFPLSTRVWGKRLGILGMGRIGQAIAQRGAGFSMQVRYHNRNTVPASPYAYEPSLIRLAEWADFLVLACPGGPSTYHLVNADVIRALGPTGILVNIARGSVIDESAMVDALARGDLGGVGLDVLEHEPSAPAALLGMDQAALMPHVGSATHETRADMSRLVFDNAQSFLRNGSLVTPIPPAHP